MSSFKIQSKHFLTGEELLPQELKGLIDLSLDLKSERKKRTVSPLLAGKTLGLVFEKPSLRTRLSFSVAMFELGGFVVETSLLTSKREEPQDVARVLAGYCHGVMVRTHEHKNLERMVEVSTIPVVNGLSDTHHPCQVLADILTLKEKYSNVGGLDLAYIGDGNNMLHSLLLLMPVLGINVRYSCPKGYEPNSFIVRQAKTRAKETGAKITAFSKPEDAAKGAHALYTDTWTSMGFEKEGDARERAFEAFQINEGLYAKAATDAMIMHCLPMSRGKEITDSMADHKNSALFQQSENRLHVQKALLLGLMGQGN